MTRPLRVGVIGLGVGEQHVIGYKAIPGVSVDGICDVNEERLAAVGDRQGISTRHTDYRRLTENPDIDVVSICSYDNVHAEQAISALTHGKHVMVEKPIALHKREAEALLRAQQDSGKRITSNLILRRSPRFRALKDMIVAGDLGEIFYLEGDYIHQILTKITQGWRGKMDFYCVSYGGGIHLIDLMRWLIDREVVEVASMGGNTLTRNSTFRYADTIVSLMRYDGGAIAKSLTTFGPQRPHFHALAVYGTKATFVNDVQDAKIYYGENPDLMQPMTAAYPGVVKSDLLVDFVTAIREGREPTVGAKDVFRVMDVCFAIWESVQAHRTVKVNYLI